MGIKRILVAMAIFFVSYGIVLNSYAKQNDFSAYSEVDTFARDYLKMLLDNKIEDAYNLMHPDMQKIASIEILRELVNKTMKNEDGIIVGEDMGNTMELRNVKVEMEADSSLYSMEYVIPMSKDKPMKYSVDIVDDKKNYQVKYISINIGETTDQAGNVLYMLINILFIPFVVYALVKCYNSKRSVKSKVLWTLGILFFTLSWGKGSLGIGLHLAITISKEAVSLPVGAFLYLFNHKEEKKEEEKKAEQTEGKKEAEDTDEA